SKYRPRDREADRSANLMEERQAAGGRPDLSRRNRALNDEGEDREDRTDSDTGDEHPGPEQWQRCVGAKVREEEQADREHHRGAQREQLVATGPGHDLPGADRADDQAAEQREDLIAGLRRRSEERRVGKEWRGGEGTG